LGRCYVIGPFEVRPDERRVLAGADAVALGARAFDLLLCLIERRDRLVSRQELIGQVWPGVVVEDNNLNVQVSALRRLLGPEAVATVGGRGYRLTVDVAEANAGSSTVAPAQPGALAPATELPLPDRPSIAVLPFANLSGDAEQEFFTDGITEDIITELSRFRQLFVIARNSSFTYRGNAVDVRCVARELGVRYVLEGSIRRAGQRIWVTAQLIDASSGNHVWAEKYDRTFGDTFALQEELTRSIVAAIWPHLEAFEWERLHRARTQHLGAYELALRAHRHVTMAGRDTDPAGFAEGVRLAKEALAIDSRCGLAWTAVAMAQMLRVYNHTAPSIAQEHAGCLDAAQRAIAIDRGDHLAYLYRGMLLLHSDRQHEGLADVRRAHELNPNDSFVLALLGLYEAGAGDPALGLRYAAEAIRRSPRDPERHLYLGCVGWAHFHAGDYQAAVDAAQRSIVDAPRFPPSHWCITLAWVGCGEIERAAEEIAILRGLAPELLDERLQGRLWPHADAVKRHRATTFLRIAAGLEGAATADVLRR